MKIDFSNINQKLDEAIKSGDYSNFKKDIKGFSEDVYTNYIKPAIPLQKRRQITTYSTSGQTALLVIALCILYPFAILYTSINLGFTLYNFYEFNMFSPVNFLVDILLSTLSIVGIVACTKRCMHNGRFQKIAKFLSKKDVCSIKELATTMKRQPSRIQRELKTWIEKEMYQDCYFSHDMQTIFLGQESYNEYMQSYALQQKIANQKAVDAQNPILMEGKQYICQIRKVNDLLPDAIISKKLDDLEEILTKIFAYVGQKPERLDQVHKFINYYLPTTIKLLNAYCGIEDSNITSTQTTKTKNEILDILDTIQIAFVSFFDNLYQEEALDISSDISVLKTMLHQDGLLR